MTLAKRSSCLISATVSALLYSSTALAQTEGALTNEAGVDEIVVTATKRAENLQKVPISISAVTGDQLAKQGVVNVTGIASQVPNFQITTPYSDAVPIFSLRGISAVDFNQNQSSPVALYVDEDYKGVPVFTSLQLFDVDRVEVLRGPQGTLFGKNTTGGAVSVSSKAPDMSAGFNGNLTAGIGRFNRFEVMGGVNIPLIEDKLAGRLAFIRTNVNGFVKNLMPGGVDQGSIDDWALRGSLVARATESLKLTLRYTHSKSTPTGYGVLADNIGPEGVAFTGYNRSGLDFFENEVDTAGSLKIRNDSVSLRADWDVSSAATLTSLTSYNNGRWVTSEDADGSPFKLLAANYYSSAKAFSQDLRLTSAGNSSLKWLVGTYFYDDSINASVNNNFFFEDDFDGDGALSIPNCLEDEFFFIGCGYTNDLRQTRKSFALYTHNDYRLEHGLTVTFGLRFTHDNNHLSRYKSFLSYLDQETGQVSPDQIPVFDRPPIDRLKSNNLSGKIGLSYEAPTGNLFYASVSRGYRGGAFNGQALFSPAEITIAKPELLYAYEVGAKLQTADRRLRLNTSAFFYNYLNQQFIDTTPELLGVLYNAPKSHLWGIEAELTARPISSLTLRLGGSYLNAKYKENNLQGEDLSGNQLVLAPRWTFAGGIDWDLIEGSSGTVALHTDHRYSSRIYFDPFNTLPISQSGYWIHDARLSYTTPSGALEIAGWIRNIGNEKYKTYALDLFQTINSNYVQRGRPREYGLQATVRF